MKGVENAFVNYQPIGRGICNSVGYSCSAFIPVHRTGVFCGRIL